MRLRFRGAQPGPGLAHEDVDVDAPRGNRVDRGPDALGRRTSLLRVGGSELDAALFPHLRHAVGQTRQAGDDLVFVSERVHPGLGHAEPRLRRRSLRRAFEGPLHRARGSLAQTSAFLQLPGEPVANLALAGDRVLDPALRLRQVRRIEAHLLHPGRDLPLEAAQLRLPRREVFGLGVARELRQVGAGAGRTQLQLRQVAAPQVALAACVAERRIRASLARRSASSARCVSACARCELAVEMAYRCFEHRDVSAQHVGVVAPFVDLQDGVGRGFGKARPRAIGRLGVGPHLAQPREFGRRRTRAGRSGA